MSAYVQWLLVSLVIWIAWLLADIAHALRHIKTFGVKIDETDLKITLKDIKFDIQRIRR